MNAPGYYSDSHDVRRVEYLLRAVVTAVLALMLVGAAVYQVLANHDFTGPLINWAGVVVGVYIGAHYGQNGSTLPRPRRATDAPPP